jgi:hypothetical protein
MQAVGGKITTSGLSRFLARQAAYQPGASQDNAASGITVSEPLPGSAAHAPGSASHVRWQPGHKSARCARRRAERS